MTAEPAAVHATHQYDAVPYQSFPFPQTEPGRLAAVAQVLGLKPPPVERASVLELGCASGGNLIPMPVRHPGARFLGIDASALQIDEGRARVTSLALGNIELRQADIRDIAKVGQIGPLDYIVSHGVYSWVPDEVRAACCRRAAMGLAPTVSPT
jgi:cyclopropane fatty-acyl-phospholipid synthase-like methyltransferase